MLMMASTGHRNYWLDRVTEICSCVELFVRLMGRDVFLE